MPTARTVLLADADVLIDYRESELGILELVARHVSRVAVLTPVLSEVHAEFELDGERRRKERFDG